MLAKLLLNILKSATFIDSHKIAATVFVCKEYFTAPKKVKEKKLKRIPNNYFDKNEFSCSKRELVPRFLCPLIKINKNIKGVVLYHD